MADKIDSNVTGAAFAEETTPRNVDAGTTWYELEPNSYGDFGGTIKTVARETINQSRQRQKGSAVDIDVPVSLQQDFTMTNHLRLLRGFFFAEYTSFFGTNEIGDVPLTLAAVSADDSSYDFGDVPTIPAGTMLFASGFAKAANNGLTVVSAAVAAGDPITVTAALVDEADTAAARLVAVGHEFAAGDVALTAFAGGMTLTSTAVANLEDATGLRVGAWVFVGGDAAGTAFAQKGYARVSAIVGNSITFDKSTVAFATNAGAGISLRLFYGRYIRNEDDPDLIKAFSYQFERTLGRDDDGVQAQYEVGAYANEFKLNIPTADKLTADLTYVAMDDQQQAGVVGKKAGTRVKAAGEGAVNTSSDVYRFRMHVVDPTTLTPLPLFGYVTQADLTIANNVTPAKGVGVFGAFAMTVGQFAVSGTTTAYFSTIAAIQAIRNSADVSLDLIVAKHNQGFIFDIPLLALGGGKLAIAKDEPVTVPLEMAAAENPNGYTFSGTFFPYLPNAAMPVQ